MLWGTGMSVLACQRGKHGVAGRLLAGVLRLEGGEVLG